MSLISIIHPSRSRPEKSVATINHWTLQAHGSDFEIIVSLDMDDATVSQYHDLYQYLPKEYTFVMNENRSAVDAINSAARIAQGDIFYSCLGRY